MPSDEPSKGKDKSETTESSTASKLTPFLTHNWMASLTAAHQPLLSP